MRRIESGKDAVRNAWVGGMVVIAPLQATPGHTTKRSPQIIHLWNARMPARYHLEAFQRQGTQGLMAEDVSVIS